MRYDAEHKSRTKAAVLKEAAQALRAAGPENISVTEIMGRVGLTHGGFYAHFPSKQALVSEAMAEAFRDSSKLFERATNGVAPQIALASYINLYLSPKHRDAPERGCPLPALASDLPRLSGDARATYAAGIERLTLRITKLLTAVGLPDPAALAASVLAEMVGALSLARAVPDHDQSDTILACSRISLLERLGLEDSRQ